MARNNEYKDIIIAGETYQPIKASKLLKKHIDELSKVSSPVQYGEPFPVDMDDLLWLYKSNKLVTSAEEYELCHQLPRIEELINPDDFQSNSENIESIENEIKDWDDSLWNKSERDSNSFKEIYIEIKKFIKELSGFNEFEIEIIDSGIKNGARKQRWIELFERVQDLKIEYENIEYIYLEYNPELNCTEEKKLNKQD